MPLEKYNKQLKDTYSLLGKVIDYQKSETCLKEKNCTFFNEEGKLSIEKDKEPGVDGPLKLGTQLIDALLLQYYEGYPLDKIVNNNIKTKEQWKQLTEIKNVYEDLLFGNKVLAKHIAQPLIGYMYDDIENSKHKVTVLVGHDSNI